MENFSPYKLANVIKTYLHDNHMSEEVFADRCGLSLTSIKSYLCGENLSNGTPTNPQFCTIVKLAQGMDLDRLALMDKISDLPVRLYPIHTTLLDLLTEKKQDSTVDVLAVERDICRNNKKHREEKTIVYRISETNMYPYIMNGDLVIVWLKSDYEDDDIIMVGSEQADNHQPLFYKVKLDNNKAILYGDAGCEPLIIDNERDCAFAEHVIGKVVSIRRQLV